MKTVLRCMIVLLISAGCVHVTCPKLIQLKAIKTNDTYGYSAIQIWQTINGKDTMTSSSKFMKDTKGAKFNNQLGEEKRKSLWFNDKSSNTVTIRFWHTASTYPPIGSGAPGVRVCEETFNVTDIPAGNPVLLYITKTKTGCTMSFIKPS